MGLSVKQQESIQVFYRKKVVGDYTADLVVDKKVIVEVKSVKELNEVHEVQLVNYLKATPIEIGLLINFGAKVKVKRKIFNQ